MDTVEQRTERVLTIEHDMATVQRVEGHVRLCSESPSPCGQSSRTCFRSRSSWPSPSEEALAVPRPPVAVEGRSCSHSSRLRRCVVSFVCRLPRSWYSVARKAHDDRVTSDSGAVRYCGWQTGVDVVLHDCDVTLACHVRVSVVSPRV